MASQLERLRAALGNRHTVDGEVGRGGRATVYLAEDLRHDRTVAISILLSDLSATLPHPHLLPAYESGESGGLRRQPAVQRLSRSCTPSGRRCP